MLLLDSNEDRSLQALSNTEEVAAESPNNTINLEAAVESIQGVSAKTYINMLSPYFNFGGGVYTMTVVKRMTAKDDFLKMTTKNCEVELYEDCRTKNLVEECNCVPWEMPGYQVGKQ